MEDPEISAMTAVSSALGALDEDAQGRVIRWAAVRYGLALPSPNRTSPKLDAGPERELTDEGIADEAPAFTHFAELFAKVQPKTDPDKAPVAAYWLQTMQGQDKWRSAELQKELKNLGHAIGT